MLPRLCYFLTVSLNLPVHTTNLTYIFWSNLRIKHITLTFGKFEELNFCFLQFRNWDGRELWEMIIFHLPTPHSIKCAFCGSQSRHRAWKKQTDGEINACWLAVYCVLIRETRPYQEENVNLTWPFAGNNGAHWFKAKETERANWLIFFRLCTGLQIRHWNVLQMQRKSKCVHAHWNITLS